MQNDLNYLKRNIPILKLAENYSFQLKKKGIDSYFCLCPWHDDKTPSLSFTPSKNMFKCFGCDRSGSVIDLVMFMEKVGTGEAIKILKRKHVGSSTIKISSVPRVEGKKTELLSPTRQKLISVVNEHYHNSLKRNSRPVEYLLKRNIRQGELIDQFKIGYVDGSLVGKLPETDIEILQSVGLLNEHGYEHFRDCVVFPVISETGEVTEIYGRCLDKARGKHFYLPGEHLGIFNPKALAYKEIFLCESIIDALSLMGLGYLNVTSSFGINGFTSEMFFQLKEKGVDKVIICYDSDKSGEKASFSLGEKLSKVDIESDRIYFVQKDANDFLCKSSNPQAEFEELIGKAKPLWVRPTKERELAESWEHKDDEVHFSFGNRKYIVRGLDKNKTNTSLKLYLRMNYDGRFHIDNSIDLFNAKLSLGFCKTAGLSLDLDAKVIKHDLDKITQLLDIELTNQIQGADDQKKVKFQKDIAISLKAVEFLDDPLMIVRFVKDVLQCGLVGESLNSFFCFLATLSRYLSDQLHVIIQSESSAGKSTMLNLVSSFVPEDDLIYLTQITPKSFYYMTEEELMGKVIAIAELDGMDQAIYPIKQMISEKKLSISYTKTDPQTGEHTSVTNMKRARSSFMLTSPKEGGDEEVDNRSVILTLDESEHQTRRIQNIQRRFRSEEGGRLRLEKEQLIRFYNHVQREIEPWEVSNIYSKSLDFKADNHRARRDHDKYLMIIESLTLFFQRQRHQYVGSDGRRTVKTHLIDIVIAGFIARRLFKTTLDELPPQTRNFFQKIVKCMQDKSETEDCDILNVCITRKEMRELTKLSNNRVHEHAHRLFLFEYMSSKREADGFRYRLTFRPDEAGDNISNNLNLVSINTLKKKATREEREEYQTFVPHLQETFKSLDPSYKDGEY